ncbi:hypothetical protein [Erythrobacter sp. CCH5-A1]|uniref:hypothetical protein n=1 Tax=Erythrobacter sp. CCH5-A1 TaxID=1768792 RepID=UPI000AD50568|nr:hypothetical protein [Erythrobacter sp. CCH5-A1]
MGENDGCAPKAHEEKTRLVDIAEDTIGFGETEWHTFRDLLVRPRAVLDTYMELGPTGGGRYKRPLGFYIALCGLLTFYLFLLGGFKGIIEAQPPETINPWLERSGKSRESFISDVDGWMSVLGTPVLSVFYALVTAPLLVWWSGLDWRRGVRATFVLLNAWTVPIVLLGPLPYIVPYQAVTSLLLQALLVVAFLRMGMGLWFRNWPVGVAKGVVLIVVLAIGSIIGMYPVLHMSLLAAALGN